MTEELYVIRKNGYFYRENAHGYTSHVSEAWRVPFEVARCHEYPHDDPVTIHKLSEFAALPPPGDVGELVKQLTRIRRTCEGSASIMRDARRTGGWAGSERTACAFDRLARDTAKAESLLADTLTTLSARLAECERERDEAREREQATRAANLDVKLHWGVLKSDYNAATARSERMKAALMPFADYAARDGFGLNHKSEPIPDGEGVGWVYLTVGDFRRAADSLAPDPAPGDGEGWVLSSEAVDALAAYQQADADGVMVKVSRQAIEECLPFLRRFAASQGGAR